MKLDQQKTKAIISATIYIIIGILFCIFRSGMLNILFTIIGALLVVGGIVTIIRKQYPMGIIETALGIVIILGAWLFVTVVIVVLGIFAILKGCLDLYLSIKNKNLIGIIFAAITMAIGICLIVSGFKLMDWFFIVMGVIAIVIGALQLVFGLIGEGNKPVENKEE